jgi:hypothetical protein
MELPLSNAGLRPDTHLVTPSDLDRADHDEDHRLVIA